MSRKAWIFVAILGLVTLAIFGLAVFGRERGSNPPASDEPTIAVTPEPTGLQTTLPAATPPGRRDLVVWLGPDDAVSSWFSEKCDREVLEFGAQQYSPGAKVSRAPSDARDLGYTHGERRLWGDRGAPRILYVTTDGARTFQEWIAVEEAC